MTIGVHLRRPEPATRRTSEGVSVIDGVTAHAYDRFARELEEAGGMTVSFVDPDRPYRLDRSVMARRDIAESMDAVGDRVYSLDEYCYLRRDDWTSLPQVLNHYLCHP